MQRERQSEPTAFPANPSAPEKIKAAQVGRCEKKRVSQGTRQFAVRSDRRDVVDSNRYQNPHKTRSSEQRSGYLGLTTEDSWEDLKMFRASILNRFVGRCTCKDERTTGEAAQKAEEG